MSSDQASQPLKGGEAEVPAKVVEVPEEEPDYYKDVELGGLRGTEFFFKVYTLVSVQYFVSTLAIFLATGEGLSDEFKGFFADHTCGIIALVLLVLLWTACYFLQFLPKDVQNKEAWWWWVVYGVYLTVFGYSAAYLSSSGQFEVNFLFNLYILTSFLGVFGYALTAHILKWYLRIGFMIITVIVFNYASWTIMHYAGLTDAGFTANLLTAGTAGLVVILGIVFTAVVLEDGFRYKRGEWVYAAIVFLVETFVIVFMLLSALYVQPRKPFIAQDPRDVAKRLAEKLEKEAAERKAAEEKAAADKAAADKAAADKAAAEKTA